MVGVRGLSSDHQQNDADDYGDDEQAGEHQQCHERAEIFARLFRHGALMPPSA